MPDAVGYDIYRKAGTGTFELLVADYQSDLAAFADRIAAGVTYTYRVEWRDGDSNVSPPSNEVTITAVLRVRR